MCSGSIEQHDLDQLEQELEEKKAVDNYVNNYRVSFSTFSLLVPSLRD
jgi:hypothetical protein